MCVACNKQQAAEGPRNERALSAWHGSYEVAAMCWHHHAVTPLPLHPPCLTCTTTTTTTTHYHQHISHMHMHMHMQQQQQQQQQHQHHEHEAQPPPRSTCWAAAGVSCICLGVQPCCSMHRQQLHRQQHQPKQQQHHHLECATQLTMHGGHAGRHAGRRKVTG